MAPQKVTKILCIGAGYVGGPTCAVIALKCPHITVTIVDLNQARIDAWNSSDFKLPIYEPGLEDVVRQCRGRNLFFSTDVEKGIREAELIFVNVNTPAKKSDVGAGFAADLNYVELATRQIAAVATSSKIVVEKSTVPCRTAESMRTILEANSKPNCRFDILSNPEFLAEGTAINNLFAPDRVLIGSLQTPEGKDACASLAGVYANWVPTQQILTVSLWSSELSKLAANAMLAQRISSVNVANAVGYDSRVGPKFLKASVGFGGSCFQKDILNFGERLHLPEVAASWHQVVEMNEYQKRRFSKRVVHALQHHRREGAVPSISATTRVDSPSLLRIAVLSFAFKADTDDTATITLIRDFRSERAFINIAEVQIWTDLTEVSPAVPLTRLRTHHLIIKQVTICASALEACRDTEAVVIATEWKEFKEIDWTVYQHMKKLAFIPAFVFDGRLLVDAAVLT
ncbi:UDP-glucose/GDP-mannose dehydrogenase [Mycena galericulata]|nr:UDP-glucose/GDP-mannose dehydrogenase [Mycena galericulata]